MFSLFCVGKQLVPRNLSLKGDYCKRNFFISIDILFFHLSLFDTVDFRKFNNKYSFLGFMTTKLQKYT